MVVLTAPPKPEAQQPQQQMSSPNPSMELAASLREMKAAPTPPRRTEEGSVLVVGSGENGRASNGPLSEVHSLPCCSGATPCLCVCAMRSVMESARSALELHSLGYF